MGSSGMEGGKSWNHNEVLYSLGDEDDPFQDIDAGLELPTLISRVLIAVQLEYLNGDDDLPV